MINMKLRNVMGAVDAQRFAPIGALIMTSLKGHAQVEEIATKETKEVGDIAAASLINRGAIRGEGFFMVNGNLVTAEKPMRKHSQNLLKELLKELEVLEKQIKELESIEDAFKKADEIADIIEGRVNNGQVIEAHLELLANLLLKKTEGFDLESLVAQIKELRAQRRSLKEAIKTEEEVRTKAKEEAETKFSEAMAEIKAKAEAKAKAEVKAEKEMMKVIETIVISDIAKLSHTSKESLKEFSLLLKRRALAAHARKCKAAKKEAEEKAEAEAERIADAKVEAQKEARAERAARKAARKTARVQRNGCLLLEKTLECLRAGATNYDQVASMLKQARKHHIKLDVYIELMKVINGFSDKYDLTMRCVWRIFWSKKRELRFNLKDNLQDILDLVQHKIELHLNPSPSVTPIKKVAKKVTNVIVDVRNVIYQHKNGKYIRYTY